jgi:hypothetical protein
VLFFDDVEVIVPNPKFVLNNETKISCIDDFIMVIRFDNFKNFFFWDKGIII